MDNHPISLLVLRLNRSLRQELRLSSLDSGARLQTYRLFRLRGGRLGPKVVLSDISAMYAKRLAFIGNTDLPTSLVRVLLTQTSCLKKWRNVVDGVDAHQRATVAIESFCDRQQDLAVQWPRQQRSSLWSLIEPVARRLISGYLPEVEPAPGRFGPGECFERYTHYERWKHLDEWAAASAHWPEFVGGEHGDFQHPTVRLSAVPKDWDKDRLITVEPAFAGFIQQGARSRLLRALHHGTLKGTAMDLGHVLSQDVHRYLCTVVDGEGNPAFATLDLQAASDNITWDLVSRLFPPWILPELEMSRSPSYSRSGTTYPMQSYAGMGNATTFAVETIVFCAIVEAVGILAYGSLRAAKRRLRTIRGRLCSVFGDDIIVPPELVPLLNRVGIPLCINASKSFTGKISSSSADMIDESILKATAAEVATSYIRESCGIFTYKGLDVTPLRVNGRREGFPRPFYWAGLALRAWQMSPYYDDIRFTSFTLRLAASVDYFADLAVWLWGRALEMAEDEGYTFCFDDRFLQSSGLAFPTCFGTGRVHLGRMRWRRELCVLQSQTSVVRTRYLFGSLSMGSSATFRQAIYLRLVPTATRRGEAVFAVPNGTKTATRWVAELTPPALRPVH